MVENKDRLFVPLARVPFIDFRDRGKEVEVRRNGYQYTLKTVVEGRLVELRLGYSGYQSIWGEVGRVVVGSWEDVFEVFELMNVEPRLNSVEEAIAENTTLLGETKILIAFEITNKELINRLAASGPDKSLLVLPE